MEEGVEELEGGKGEEGLNNGNERHGKKVNWIRDGGNE